MYRLIFAFFLLLGSPFCYAVERSEEILNFISDIAVNTDASIDVTEKITVYANQETIKHGIVRWLPNFYIDSKGVKQRLTYRVSNVLMDQVKSPYHIKKTPDQFGIYIGAENKLLAQGTYIYTIRYHVNNAVNFLKDQDEIYWNVTGNHWTFPIVSTTAEVWTPGGAKVLKYAGFTGELGSKDKDFSIGLPASNEIVFHIKKPLKPTEGLTIAVAWPKGYIHKPSAVKRLETQLLSHTADSISLGIIICLLSYYLIAWYCCKTHRNTILPLFEPPLNLPPAAIRFISKMQYDTKTFTAAIISMATKGYLTIQQHNNQFTLFKNNSSISLSDDETILAARLFKNKSSMLLDAANARDILNAQSAFKSTLTSDYKNNYFVTNNKYLVPGLVLGLLAFGVVILSAVDKKETFFAAFWLSIWTFSCCFLLFKFWDSIKQAFQFVSFSTVSKVLLFLILSLGFIGGEILGIMVFSNVISMITMSLLLVIVAINLFFYYLLRSPTQQGQIIMDQIEGFKLFLSTTERYRFEQLHPPKKTPELFEKFLAYAIALDVENKWGAQFNDLLTSATYKPKWYDGTSWNVASASSFSSHLNNSLTERVNSSTSSNSGSLVGDTGSSSGGGRGGISENRW